MQIPVTYSNTPRLAAYSASLYRALGKRIATYATPEDPNIVFTVVSGPGAEHFASNENILDKPMNQSGIDLDQALLVPVPYSEVDHRLRVIFAAQDDDGIGKGGELPWHIREDLLHFKAATMGCPVIMGLQTYRSLPPNGLPNRHLIVVSTTLEYQSGQKFDLVRSLDEAIARARHVTDEEYYVIGGTRLFEEAIRKAFWVHATAVHHDQNQMCDAYIPYIWERLESDYFLMDKFVQHERCTIKMFRRVRNP